MSDESRHTYEGMFLLPQAATADLKTAIDGCHRSPHHCGENDRGAKYQSLELIMRDSKHVLQFLEVPAAMPSQRLQRSVRAGENWLALKREQDARES